MWAVENLQRNRIRNHLFHLCLLREVQQSRRVEAMLQGEAKGWLVVLVEKKRGRLLRWWQ